MRNGSGIQAYKFSETLSVSCHSNIPGKCAEFLKKSVNSMLSESVNSMLSEERKRKVSYLPKFCTVLVSEPDNNRIGIYNARCWLLNCILKEKEKKLREGAENFGGPSSSFFLGGGRGYVGL